MAPAEKMPGIALIFGFNLLARYASEPTFFIELISFSDISIYDRLRIFNELAHFFLLVPLNGFCFYHLTKIK